MVKENNSVMSIVAPDKNELRLIVSRLPKIDSIKDTPPKKQRSAIERKPADIISKDVTYE
jgi:hypothetical protein